MPKNLPFQALACNLFRQLPELASMHAHNAILLTGGLGLKHEHYAEALDSRDPGLWFEVHAENYMGAGGPRMAWLQAMRDAHPVSLHGVGMSIGADAPPDEDHLARLAELVKRYEPALVSEHLAWSSWGGAALPDLLPVPRTHAALLRVADNVTRLQDRLGRTVAIENPSHYVAMPWHEYSEAAFLGELARRAGCQILLDVNNVYVSARNLGFAALDHLQEILDTVGGERIVEIHLAGHSTDPAHGARLLVDSHDAPVAAEVWTLYEQVIAQIGPRPTLIERDGNVPAFGELLIERERAHTAMQRLSVAERA